jgi:hypothetical protein
MYGGLSNPGSSTAPFRSVQYAEIRTNTATKQANTITGVERSDFIVLFGGPSWRAWPRSNLNYNFDS